MLQRLLFLCALLAPFSGLAQEFTMSADEYFALAGSIAYPARYSFKTVTIIEYPKVNTYTDSGTTIIDNDRIYVHSKSGTVLNGNIGTLNLNHETKIAVFSPSDSLMKEIVAKFPEQYADKNDYSLIKPYLEKAQHSLYTKEQEAFIREHCTIVRKLSAGRVEITIRPKDKATGYFISGKVVLNEQRQLVEMETVYRDIYAHDYNGDDRYRIVHQKNAHYQYTAVGAIPVRLDDFIEFRNWKIKLKKYTDYKLDVL